MICFFQKKLVYYLINQIIFKWLSLKEVAQIENGYPQRSLKRKGLSTFIRKYADNLYEGSKTWIKREESSLGTVGAHNPPVNDKEMIKYLKNKGYKIMKPSSWVEC